MLLKAKGSKCRRSGDGGLSKIASGGNAAIWICASCSIMLPLDHAGRGGGSPGPRVRWWVCDESCCGCSRNSFGQMVETTFAPLGLQPISSGLLLYFQTQITQFTYLYSLAKEGQMSGMRK